MRNGATAAVKEDMERLFELSSDLFATASLDGRFLSLNPAWEHVLGWSREELTARPLLEFVHPDDRERTAAAAIHPAEPGSQVINFENRYRHRDGGWRWLLWSARTDGETWFAVAKDVTERKELERRARLDPLTGLANRTVLMDRIEDAAARARAAGRVAAVLFLDLDRFKVTNDMLGHATGDSLLKAAARRLEQLVRGQDTVARLGGDEFVVVAELDGPMEAEAMARRVVRAFERPFTVDCERHTLQASAGLALAGPDDDRDAEALLHEADMAMYRAKGKGRERFELFDEAMRRQVREQVELSGELRRALERDELRLVYQPVVRVGDGSVAACEALLRWAHPERGLVPPARFVPLAEENGLIGHIGLWVLEQACRQAARWRRAGAQLEVSVNVSPDQLLEGDFADVVERTCHAAQLPPECLWVEVVEAGVVHRPRHVISALRELRELGVRIALDDFGKGATSLSHFRELALDVVKLDRSFIEGLAAGVEDRAVVAAVLSLADEMGLMVVAEGIESEAQLSELRQLGCEYAQGFWFARPGPPEDLDVSGFAAQARPGLGDPYVIREFMRQIGIPARIR